MPPLPAPRPRFARARREAPRSGAHPLAIPAALTLALALGACGPGAPGGDAAKSAQAKGAGADKAADKSGGKGGPGKGPGGPVPARVLEVQPRRVPILIDAVGQAEGARQVEVRARVAGTLHKRLYTEGELVREGQPLFQIDPEPFRIALAQSQAQLAQANAQLAQARAQLAQERARNEQARRENARLKELADERAVSRREFDDSVSVLKLSDAALLAFEASVKNAEASVKNAEAGIRNAELNLSYTEVRAPVAGVSGRALRSEGSLLATAGAEGLLTTINQIQPVWVRFAVAGSDLARVPGGRIGRGAQVELTLADGGAFPAKGRINFSASQVDPRLGTQELRAEFDNPSGRLLPGDFVRVRVIAGQRDAVFLVPQTAVLQNERGYFLFVIDPEGRAQIRPVKAGDWVGRDWTILEGLKSGDRVVVDNLLRMQPGVPVKPLDPNAPPPDVPGAGKGGPPPDARGPDESRGAADAGKAK